MPFYEKQVISGNVTEIYQYYSCRQIKGDYQPRGINRNTTPEEKQAINIREARRKLARLINANFGNNDYFIRLSYKKEPTKETAVKAYRNFIRRLKYYIQKNGLEELKYISVTEQAKGRYHHHIISNFTDLNVIMSIWNSGGVYAIPLWSDEYEGLAKYITKETIRMERGKRWSQSRNLKKPVVRTKLLKRERLHGPKIPKGHILLESECFTTNFGHRQWYVKTINKTDGFYETEGG